MSTERHKAIVAIVRRLFDEAWNTGRLDATEELYATDYVADYRPYGDTELPAPGPWKDGQ